MSCGIRVAVLGSGEQACEIARSRAHVGHDVRLWDPEDEALAGAVARIRAWADTLPWEERQRTLDGILATTDLEEALSGAAVVIDTRE